MFLVTICPPNNKVFLFVCLGFLFVVFIFSRQNLMYHSLT